MPERQSDGMGNRNWIFGYLKSAEELVFKANSTRFFGIFDDFSKFHSTFSTLHFEKSSNSYGKNLAKNEEKPC